ncbi:MAG TPA: GNAT family N-acetyltransferase [Gemmatimonadaceae bacterium]
MILGVALGIAEGSVPTKMPPHFWVARDGDDIVMTAFMSLSGKLNVTRAMRPDAIGALMRDVHERGVAVETLNGPEPTSTECAKALAALRGLTTTRVFAQRIHELKRVDHLGNASGRMRLARLADVEKLIPWTADFYIDVGMAGSDPAEGVRYRIAQEQLYVWDNDGPVSMAAWTGKTPNGVRVAYVYTPPTLRGKGYATSNVAHLTKLLLERGNRFCCLYTDLANPTSNAIYARIGYRALSDAGVWRLGGG